MNWTTVSITFWVFVAVGGSLYDIIPATNAVDGDTLSEVARYAGVRFPVVPYSASLLIGHFWMGQQAFDLTAVTELKLALWSIWMVGILSIAFYKADYQLGWWSALTVILAGLMAGHFLWSQAN